MGAEGVQAVGGRAGLRGPAADRRPAQQLGLEPALLRHLQLHWVHARCDCEGDAVSVSRKGSRWLVWEFGMGGLSIFTILL